MKGPSLPEDAVLPRQSQETRCDLVHIANNPMTTLFFSIDSSHECTLIGSAKSDVTEALSSES